MSYDAQYGPPENLQIMSAEDAAEIDKGARMLPGKWFVDTFPDISTTTQRIWVRPSLCNAISTSIGFSKWRGIFLVTVRHPDASSAEDDGTPYGDLSTAFSAIGDVLLIMMHDSRQGSSTVTQTGCG